MITLTNIIVNTISRIDLRMAFCSIASLARNRVAYGTNVVVKPAKHLYPFATLFRSTEKSRATTIPVPRMVDVTLSAAPVGRISGCGVQSPVNRAA